MRRGAGWGDAWLGRWRGGAVRGESGEKMSTHHAGAACGGKSTFHRLFTRLIPARDSAKKRPMTDAARCLKILAAALLCLLLCQCAQQEKEWEHRDVKGRSAIIIGGKAVPPADAPPEVLRAITAGNRICRKPYRRGGGHARFDDSAYDCSGSVSYILHAAGQLDEPTTSAALRKFGDSGKGKWITVYAKNGHAFCEVCGLRFDTGYSDHDSRGPRWSSRSRPIKGFSVRHPEGL